MSQTNTPLPRQVADAYVDDLIALDPVTGTYLGVQESSSRLPDTSPAGQQALVGLVHGEFGGEPLAQQARAAALDVTLGAGPALRLVELGECGPLELREGLLARG